VKRARLYTWFERDRAHVEIRDEDTEETIYELWDEDVYSAIEDGFIDPKDYLGSMIRYAESLGVIKKKRICAGVKHGIKITRKFNARFSTVCAFN